MQVHYRRLDTGRRGSEPETSAGAGRPVTRGPLPSGARQLPPRSMPVIVRVREGPERPETRHRMLGAAVPRPSVAHLESLIPGRRRQTEPCKYPRPTTRASLEWREGFSTARGRRLRQRECAHASGHLSVLTATL